MNYAELASLQYGRSKSFSEAQTAAMAAYCQAEHDLKQLQAENAKLRELVADMCKAFIHGPCYRWCEHMPEPCNGDKCQYVRRMRELGVEV